MERHTRSHHFSFAGFHLEWEVRLVVVAAWVVDLGLPLNKTVYKGKKLDHRLFRAMVIGKQGR